MTDISIVGEPQVEPYPHIDNPFDFWVAFAARTKPTRISITQKLDGTNIRIAKCGQNYFLLTRNQVAEQRFTKLTLEALTPQIEKAVKDELKSDGDYLVFELEGQKNKTPYATNVPIRLVGIDAYISDKNGKKWRQDWLEIFKRYGIDTPEELHIEEINKDTLKQLAEEAYRRGWEGVVIRAYYEDGVILRGKVKPFHFGFPFKGKVDKTAKVGISEIVIDPQEEAIVVDELNKLKLKLTKEEFVDPKVLMPLLMKELKEEYKDRKIGHIFHIYQKYCLTEVDTS